MHFKAFGVAFLCAAFLSVPVVAHHSHGNYDLTTWTVMEGTVKQVVFIVPHSIVYIDVKGDVWALEATNPQGIFLKGVKKEDVKVSVQDGMLTIQGERKMEKEEKNKKFHRVECSYGNFVRSFRLPDDADENKVKAEFKDGMLNVSLPKTEKAKSRSINVAVS